MENKIIYPEESYKIIGAAMEAHSVLGSGFTEPIYQEALDIELNRRGIPHEREKYLDVEYKGVHLRKNYRVDFLYYDKIILELKAVAELKPEHMSQIINYLKASGFKLGILINFAKTSLDYKRIPRAEINSFKFA